VHNPMFLAPCFLQKKQYQVIALGSVYSGLLLLVKMHTTTTYKQWWSSFSISYLESQTSNYLQNVAYFPNLIFISY